MDNDVKLNFDELVKQDVIFLSNEGLRDHHELDPLYKVIQESIVLERLYLNGNSLTLADGKLANAIAKNKSIKELSLSFSSINLQGIKHLTDALKENNTLEILNLDDNNIGDEGAKCLAEMLADNETLQTIGLSNNNIGTEGIKHLADALKENKTLGRLYLGRNTFGDEGAEKFAEALESNHNIKTIELDGNNISKDMMNRIKATLKDPKKKIENNEDNNAKEDKDVDKNKSGPMIETRKKLDLNELVKETVCLDKKGLQDDDLDPLCKVIVKSTCLNKLSLRDNKLTLSDGKLADAIAKNTTLKKLSLQNNNIAPEGVKLLADVLKRNNTLQMLYLTGNNIGAEGAKYLADMLAVNKTLQEIGLSNNNINLQGVKHLANALKNNNTLEVLDLGSNNIDDEEAKYIADMLIVNKTLQAIKLSYNKIGDEGAESIATSLNKNTSLHKVVLEWNKITGKGAEKLADALESNHSIKTLSLNGNNNISKDVRDRIKAILRMTLKKKRKMDISKDEEIALLRAKLKALEESETTTIIQPPRTKNTTKRKIKSLQLGYEHTHCSITCHSKFSTDTDSKDENIRKHLPVLSSSKTCDHYFCHGCILRRQAAIAEENNGKVPKWIPCMVCNTKTAFCPSEPKYHRLLIDIIKQANWTDAPQIKEEPAD